MTLENFYLTCFVIGFTFSLVSFLAGATHLHVHVPKAFHLGHVGHAAHGAGAHFPFFNPLTLAAFLTWFGGAGYLAARHHWVMLTGLSVATVAGLCGAGIVFLVVGKFLMENSREMDQADYEMVGVLGRICSRVRENGTGEIIYEQMGVRRVCAARSELNEPIEKGTEVVVTRFERGVAYVRRWDELTDEHGAGASPSEQIRN
jgi:membrane protein implicated in regulation of membrane protease activity